MKFTQMTPQVHEVINFGPYEDILEIWHRKPFNNHKMSQKGPWILIVKMAAMVLIFSEYTLLVPWLILLLQPDPLNTLNQK
jgi:hypothetical protein